MSRYLAGIFIILMLGSCYHTIKETSFNMAMVIPADSMVSLLTDIHLADGVINTVKPKNITIEHLSNEYFSMVLIKHKVGRDTFQESLRYYAYHTEELDKIYEKVIINLSKIESMIPEKKE
jgi:hypothetical protein